MAEYAQGTEDTQNDNEGSEDKHIDSSNNEVNISLILINFDLIIERDQQNNSN